MIILYFWNVIYNKCNKTSLMTVFKIYWNCRNHKSTLFVHTQKILVDQRWSVLNELSNGGYINIFYIGMGCIFSLKILLFWNKVFLLRLTFVFQIVMVKYFPRRHYKKPSTRRGRWQRYSSLSSGYCIFCPGGTSCRNTWVTTVVSAPHFPSLPSKPVQ